MRRAVLGLIALAASLACLSVSTAEATKQAEFLRGPIVPGKSVGPLRLGMSEQAARRALRKLDPGSRLVKRIRKGTATEYLEYTYPYDYTSYTVGYLGRPGKRRVVFAMSHVDENKTREGVGVSALEVKLARTYRGLRCQNFYGVTSNRRKECLLGSPNRPHTIFVVGAGETVMGRPSRPPRIIRVLVEQPFKRF